MFAIACMFDYVKFRLLWNRCVLLLGPCHFVIVRGRVMTLDTMWKNYQHSLQRFVQSKVSNKEDAEDLLQEILLKAYRNIGSVQHQSSIKSWLFQVANNAVIDFYRRKGRNVELTDELLGSAEEQTQLELSNCVFPFINALPQDHAALLRAIDIDCISQKDYARELGISYSTLKSRVQKSRKLLKQLFEECCDYQRDKAGNIYDYDAENSNCFQVNGCHS